MHGGWGPAGEGEAMAVTTDTGRAIRQTTGDLRLRTEPEPGTVAHTLRPLLVALLGADPVVRVVLWDDSAFGSLDPVGAIVVRSPQALQRMLWAPGELGLSRAYVAGDLDVDGDILATLSVLRHAPARVASRTELVRTAGLVANAARSVGAI